MNVIVCLDDEQGMLFHQRRQSRDRVVNEKIQQRCAGHRLWIHPYSAGVYAGLSGVEIIVAKDFLSKAGEEDFCLVETEPLQPVADKIRRLILFWWNRKYPADMRLDLTLEDWELENSEEFPGYSHEKITEEIYKRKGK